jgi:hypothetical protein
MWAIQNPKVRKNAVKALKNPTVRRAVVKGATRLIRR